jgi:hypothetical protein
MEEVADSVHLSLPLRWPSVRDLIAKGGPMETDDDGQWIAIERMEVSVSGSLVPVSALPEIVEASADDIIAVRDLATAATATMSFFQAAQPLEAMSPDLSVLPAEPDHNAITFQPQLHISAAIELPTSYQPIYNDWRALSQGTQPLEAMSPDLSVLPAEPDHNAITFQPQLHISAAIELPTSYQPIYNDWRALSQGTQPLEAMSPDLSVLPAEPDHNAITFQPQLHISAAIELPTSYQPIYNDWRALSQGTQPLEAMSPDLSVLPAEPDHNAITFQPQLHISAAIELPTSYQPIYNDWRALSQGTQPLEAMSPDLSVLPAEPDHNAITFQPQLHISAAIELPTSYQPIYNDWRALSQGTQPLEAMSPDLSVLPAEPDHNAITFQPQLHISAAIGPIEMPSAIRGEVDRNTTSVPVQLTRLPRPIDSNMTDSRSTAESVGVHRGALSRPQTRDRVNATSGNGGNSGGAGGSGRGRGGGGEGGSGDGGSSDRNLPRYLSRLFGRERFGRIEVRGVSSRRFTEPFQTDAERTTNAGLLVALFAFGSPWFQSLCARQSIAIENLRPEIIERPDKEGCYLFIETSAVEQPLIGMVPSNEIHRATFRGERGMFPKASKLLQAIERSRELGGQTIAQAARELVGSSRLPFVIHPLFEEVDTGARPLEVAEEVGTTVGSVGALYHNGDAHCTSALHVGQSANISYLGGRAKLSSPHLVTDSCVLDLESGKSPNPNRNPSSYKPVSIYETADHFGGIPGLGSRVAFVGAASGYRDTYVNGADLECLDPSTFEVARIRTDAVTMYGDSGAALLLGAEIVGFGYRTSSFKLNQPQYSLWAWAGQVANAHRLPGNLWVPTDATHAQLFGKKP